MDEPFWTWDLTGPDELAGKKLCVAPEKKPSAPPASHQVPGTSHTGDTYRKVYQAGVKG